VVYSLGRKEYGRLGLGENNLEEKSKPTVIPALRNKKCVHVNCGTAVSYAVTNDGIIFHFLLFVSYISICDILVTVIKRLWIAENLFTRN